MKFISLIIIQTVLSIFTNRCDGDFCETYLPAEHKNTDTSELQYIKTIELDEALKNSYDVIVVGGGGTGCPFARIMADKGFKTLLIERGKSRIKHKLTHSIYGAGLAIADEEIAQPLLLSNGVRSHLASVLGGGTSIGMGIMIMENESYLQKIEEISKIELDRRLFNESLDWISKRLSYRAIMNEPYTQSLIKMYARFGFTRYYGQSEHIKEGGLWNAYSMFNSKLNFFRHSADFVLGNSKDPQPDNLQILTEYQVDRIVFEKTDEGKNVARCVKLHKTNAQDIKQIGTTNFTNIERREYAAFYRRDGDDRIKVSKDKSFIESSEETHEICASKNIVMATGAIYTPIILARSGIGNPKQLEELGISNPILINEHIGNHFIDRGLVPVALFRNQEANQGSELPAQICGVVGLVPLSAPKSIDIMKDENNVFRLNSQLQSPALGSLEEITGARIIEGFIYATRILFPPKIRNNILIDQMITLLNWCSETKRENPICSKFKDVYPCLRKVSAVWYLINEPKSEGYVHLYRNGMVEVNPQYFTHPKDKSDAISAVQTLLKVTRANEIENSSYSVDSKESCSALLTKLVNEIIETVLKTSPYNRILMNYKKINLFERPAEIDNYKYYTHGLYANQTISTWPPSIPDSDNESDIESYIYQTVQTIWHNSGTARLGLVVDHDFSVIGIDNLSIIDTSILPQMTRMNPTFTVLVLAVYAASVKSRILAT